MYRLLAVALCLSLFLPSPASAVDIKNIRARYGALGAVRKDTTCLPADVVFLSFDLENLALDKAGKGVYTMTFEFIDGQNKVLYKNNTKMEVVPQLGGNSVPGSALLYLDTKQAPGDYTMKVTIFDQIGNNGKAFSHSFKVLPATFGFIGVASPAVGIVGFPVAHETTFGLVNMTLDKNGKPDAKVVIRLLDEHNKEVRPATELLMPRDMPDDTDLQKANFVPLRYTLALNRPGRFTIDIQATDKLGNKTASLRIPLTVLDVREFDGK